MLRAMSAKRSSNELGQRLRELRRRAGLSQTSLAWELEQILSGEETVTQSAVSQWELGDSFPSPGKLRAYAEVTGADVDELLRLRAGVTGEQPRQQPAGYDAKIRSLSREARQAIDFIIAQEERGRGE